MARSPKVLAFAGSTRDASFNKQLVRIAARGVEAAGISCTLIDLRDHPLPIYDGDLEASEGLPESALALRGIIAEHDGFWIASPEYNGSISALLKNSIDWCTRSPEGTPDLSPFFGKVAALSSASPGRLGGLRGLGVLRSLLSNLGVTVLANQFTLRKAAEAFTAEGEFRSEHDSQQVDALARKLASVVRNWGD